MTASAQCLLTLDDILAARYPAFGVPLALSPDGAWLAAALKGPHEDLLADPVFTGQGVCRTMLGSRIALIQQESGEMLEPFPGTSWAPRWSPDGSRLAGYVQHEGHACLALYELATRTHRLLRDIAVRPYAFFEAPQWLPDNRRVVVKRYMPDASPAAAPSTTVFRYHPDEPEPPDQVFGSHMLGNLVLVDSENGKCTTLAPQLKFSCARISPDGRAVAVMHIAESDLPRMKVFYDVTVFPFDGSPAITVARQVINDWGATLSWSADNRSLAFAGGSEFAPGSIFVVPADGSSEPINLSHDNLNLAHEFRPPYWKADGTALYRQVGSDLWCFPTDGSPARSVTPAFPESTVYAWMLPPLGDAMLIEHDDVPVLYYHLPTGDNGIALINLQTGDTHQTATIPAGMIMMHGGMERVVSNDGMSYYAYLESTTRLPEIWRQDARTGEARCVSRINPSLGGIALGSTQRLEWVMPDGTPMSGTLLLPPQYREGDRIPLVVEGYAGGSLADRFNQGIGSTGLFINPYIIAAQGYAMLYPNMPLEGEGIRRRIGAMIDAAVDQVVGMGIADPERLAIVGQSYSGYTALSAITCTTRFKAAVVSGAIGDLLRMYATMDNQGVAFGVGYCESGQGGIGGSVWEKLDRYLEESPFYHLDTVQTPTLLMAGTQDFIANDQAQEIFIGLRRLGVPVEVRLYHGEQHAPIEWTDSRKRDFYRHTLAWLERYLGQEEAPN